MTKKTFYKLILIKISIISVIILIVMFQDKIFAKFFDKVFLHCVSYDAQFEVLLNKPGKNATLPNKLEFIKNGKTIASAVGNEVSFSSSKTFADAETANAKNIRFEMLAAHVHGLAILNADSPAENKVFVICYKQKLAKT